MGTLQAFFASTAITVDGNLNEACYQQIAPLEAFVMANDNSREVPSTKAWVFWSDSGLSFAFECVDDTPARTAPTSNEREVNGQDRVELFLWNGDPTAEYYCIEVASSGAVHDYKARFYREFDHSWAPAGGWSYQVTRTDDGYVLEANLPKAAIEAMGGSLAAGETTRIGLFRADFDTLNGEPSWITWIDYGGEPDFHVADSFGSVQYQDKE